MKRMKRRAALVSALTLTTALSIAGCCDGSPHRVRTPKEKSILHSLNCDMAYAPEWKHWRDDGLHYTRPDPATCPGEYSSSTYGPAGPAVPVAPAGNSTPPARQH